MSIFLSHVAEKNSAFNKTNYENTSFSQHLRTQFYALVANKRFYSCEEKAF
jgi:hypothetical protein